jgi:hypothetical protein
MFQQEYYDQLVAKGLTVAAERYVATYGGRKQESLFDVPAVEVKPEGHVTVTCAKVRCGTKATMARSEANRWFCETHLWVTEPVVTSEPVVASVDVDSGDDDGPVLYYHGNLYEPHIVNFDGIAFRQRNGKVVTLDPSKVEWIRPPR